VVWFLQKKINPAISNLLRAIPSTPGIIEKGRRLITTCNRFARVSSLAIAVVVGSLVGCDMNPSSPTDPSPPLPKNDLSKEVTSKSGGGGQRATKSIKDRTSQPPAQ
jgi:hypothetical protein